MIFDSHSPSDTKAFGKQLASLLQAGDVLLLYGDMGAGKSELTRGIAAGLGITGAVTSPTFTIMQQYDSGRLPLYHFDWYRIACVDELYELSMDEYLGGDGIAIVEWPTQVPEAIPRTHLQITLTPTGDEGRTIALVPMGDFREIEIKDVPQ